MNKDQFEKLLPVVRSFAEHWSDKGVCFPDNKCRAAQSDHDADCDRCWEMAILEPTYEPFLQAIALLKQAVDLASEYPMCKDGQYYSFACDAAEYLGLPKPEIVEA